MKLGILKRMCSDFNNSSALKILGILFPSTISVRRVPDQVQHIFLYNFCLK